MASCFVPRSINMAYCILTQAYASLFKDEPIANQFISLILSLSQTRATVAVSGCAYEVIDSAVELNSGNIRLPSVLASN